MLLHYLVQVGSSRLLCSYVRRLRSMTSRFQHLSLCTAGFSSCWFWCSTNQSYHSLMYACYPFSLFASPVRASGHSAPLIRSLISALYNIVYIVCFCTYPLSLHFFLTRLLPYLSFPSRIDPLHFQAGCRKRQLNLALIFLVFILCCSTFFDWWTRAFVVLGLVFSTLSQDIGLWKRLRNDLFCVEWDVKPQLNQPMNSLFASSNVPSL